MLNSLIIAPVYFPSYTDIIMLNSNQFLAIADNRERIQGRLAGVGYRWYNIFYLDA